jgi:6,7-dimethyl-8-ribityllumazine synthase
MRLVIIAAEFNASIIDEMIGRAKEEVTEEGSEVVGVVRVPGCYEIPLVADLHMMDPEVHGLIILGYIERGETLHGEVMGHVVHNALVNLQLKYHKPCGVGIIGPGATLEQARQRQHEYAASAARAACRMGSIIESLHGKGRKLGF